MTKTLKKLEELNSRIADCESEIKSVQNLPFYRIFNQEAQRQKDIDNLLSLKADLIEEKLILFCRLEDEIQVERENMLKDVEAA